MVRKSVPTPNGVHFALFKLNSNLMRFDCYYQRQQTTIKTTQNNKNEKQITTSKTTPLWIEYEQSYFLQWKQNRITEPYGVVNALFFPLYAVYGSSFCFWHILVLPCTFNIYENDTFIAGKIAVCFMFFAKLLCTSSSSTWNENPKKDLCKHFVSVIYDDDDDDTTSYNDTLYLSNKWQTHTIEWTLCFFAFIVL